MRCILFIILIFASEETTNFETTNPAALITSTPSFFTTAETTTPLPSTTTPLPSTTTPLPSTTQFPFFHDCFLAIDQDQIFSGPYSTFELLVSCDLEYFIHRPLKKNLNWKTAFRVFAFDSTDQEANVQLTAAAKLETKLNTTTRWVTKFFMSIKEQVSTINTTITLRGHAFQDETLGAVKLRGDFALINWGGCASPIFQNVPAKIVAKSTFDVEIVYPYSSLVTKSFLKLNLAYNDTLEKIQSHGLIGLDEGFGVYHNHWKLTLRTNIEVTGNMFVGIRVGDFMCSNSITGKSISVDIMQRLNIISGECQINPPLTQPLQAGIYHSNEFKIRCNYEYFMHRTIKPKDIDVAPALKLFFSHQENKGARFSILKRTTDSSFITFQVRSSFPSITISNANLQFSHDAFTDNDDTPTTISDTIDMVAAANCLFPKFDGPTNISPHSRYSLTLQFPPQNFTSLEFVKSHLSPTASEFKDKPTILDIKPLEINHYEKNNIKMYDKYKINLLSSNISTSEINTITWEVSSKECTNKLTKKTTQIFAQRNIIVEEIMSTTIVPDDGDSNLGSGDIAAIICGSLLFILSVTYFVLYCQKRKIDHEQTCVSTSHYETERETVPPEYIALDQNTGSDYWHSFS